MAPLKDKIENALNEGRTLILGVQVLIGFQFESVLQKKFEKLPASEQTLLMVGLALMLLTLGLLLSPASYHRLVARGEDTAGLHRFTGLVTGIALFPFALGLAINIYVSFAIVSGLEWALPIALIALGVILFFWYGLEVFVRMHNAKKPTGQQEKVEPTELSEKIKHVLTEARMVLPGAQALLGFQFIAMLMESFDTLPALLKYIHLASLATIALSTVLLMAPAAYHRIVEEGEETERFLHFASNMVLAAMVLLALGIAGDFNVVVAHVSGSNAFALVCALVVLVVFYGLWFGLMLVLRARQQPLSATR